MPDKKSINPTIDSHLENLWCDEWSAIKGHKQTKYWLTRPDPCLASKLMNMSREYLGKCIPFFTGHGWGQKHLTVVNLCNDEECRLCCKGCSEETPIHIFEECVAIASSRQGLFNNPYPTQVVSRESLCQVAELALIDTVHDLTDINQNYSNISSME